MDIHTHGLGGYDSRAGRASAIVSLAQLHGRAGVSAIVPSVYSAPIDKMRQDLAAIAGAMDAGTPKGSSRILGAHLEGPFLNPSRAGALDGGSFAQPTMGGFMKLVRGYEHLIRMITIAPELKGATRLIERAASMGIRVSMGHSEATLAQAARGKLAGATGVTHLFNAMPPMHHREPGLAGFALMDPDLYVEVIADGVHISPEMLRMIFALKSHNRVIAISDSVKGPMKKRGVLQGGGSPLPEARLVLRELGLPDRSLRMALGTNAMRFLGLRHGGGTP